MNVTSFFLTVLTFIIFSSCFGQTDLSKISEVWLRADEGTSTTLDDDVVITWINQSDFSDVFIAINTPTFQTDTENLFNYNPSIQFVTASSSYFTGQSVWEPGDALSEAAVFIVANVASTSGGGGLFGERVSFTRFMTHHTWGDGILYWTYDGSGWQKMDPSIINERQLLTFELSETNNTKTISLEGERVSFSGSDTYSSGGGGEGNPFYVGAGIHPFAPFGPDYYADAVIAEIIVCKNGFNFGQDRQKIESYLAVKYGFTLSVDNNGNDIVLESPNSMGIYEGDYLSINGDLLWDASENSDYHNDVIGVGREDSTGLYQKQSHSIDDSLHIYISTLEELNFENTGVISNDISYVLMGHNRDMLCGIYEEIPPSIAPANRIAREWKITKTNFSDGFNFDFIINPFEPITDYDPDLIRLLVSDSPDMTDAIPYGTGSGLIFSIDDNLMSIKNVTNTQIPDNSTKYVTIAYLEPEISISGPETICFGDSLELTFTFTPELGAISFDVFEGVDTFSVNDIMTGDGVMFYTDETTTYHVIGNNSPINCDFSMGTELDSLTVVVVDSVIAPFGLDTSLCGGPLVLDASNPGSDFSWQDGSTAQTLTVSSSGTYWVEVSNLCSSLSDTFTVFIDEPIDVDLGPDTLFCNFIDYELDAGNPTSDFLWQDGSTTQLNYVTSPGVYWVEVSGEQCFDKDSIVISLETVTAGFSVFDTTGCRPQEVQFEDSSISSGIISNWFWDFGDSYTSFVADPSHDYEDVNTYEVLLVVETSEGCIDSMTRSIFVEIYPTPIADFFSDYWEILQGDKIDLTNNSFDELSWFWDFGNGETSTVENPTDVCYTSPGNLPITLIVSHSFCSDTVTKVVNVKGFTSLYVPNVFTPDGDGYNNLFQPVFTSEVNPSEYHLAILNRWGEVVFESYNPDVGWDGTHGDKGLVQDGIYVWLIEFKDINSGEKHMKEGFVTIIK